MPAKQDFFISYNKADAEIAGWIAAQLQEAGYTVVIESEDFAAGGNFVLEMHRRLEECERVIAVLSPDYLTAKHVHAEWGAAFRRDPTGELRLLLPVRVRPCQPGGLLASIVYIDLAGLPEADAAQRLRAEIAKSLHSAQQASAGDPSRLPSLPPGPAPAASPAIVAYARHQLPPPPRVFIGRDDEVAALLDQFGRSEAGGTAICGSLQGMGGVGKTALALVLAHRLAGRYPAAQLYRDLRGDNERQRQPLAPAEVMRDLILSLQPDCGQLPEDEERLGPIYRAVLADAGRVLLLLDNAAGAGQIEPLLPPPGCLLLVTSRQHFGLPGLVARVLDCLAPAEATELLLHFAPRLGGHAAEAARLCGGLPLALEVFAGVLNDQSLTPVAELITALRAGEVTLRPVVAAFAVMEALLPANARDAWHRLAIFTASFDLPAAGAVWETEPAATRATLQALVDASVIEVNDETSRFRLHDLARQFTENRLTPTARETARFLHARHYIAVGEEANRLYLQGGQQVLAGLLLFDRERVQIEAAFTWLRSREQDESYARLLISLVDSVLYVAELRLHPQQRITWLRAQQSASQLTGDLRAEGNALRHLGLAYAALGDAQTAIASYQQSLDVFHATGDLRAEGSILGNLGNAYSDLGDLRNAITFQERALAIFRQIGDRRGEGETLGNLGLAHAASGKISRAIEHYEQRLLIAREFGDRRGEGATLGNLGNAHALLGEFEKAIEFHESARAIDVELGNRRGQSQDLNNLGNAYASLGDASKAAALYEHALSIAREIGDRRGEASALLNRGLAYAASAN